MESQDTLPIPVGKGSDSPYEVLCATFETLGMVPDNKSKMSMFVESLKIRSIPYHWGGSTGSQEGYAPPKTPLTLSELEQAYTAAHEMFFQQFIREMEGLGVRGRYWSHSNLLASIREAGAEAMLKDVHLAKREYQYLILGECGRHLSDNVSAYLDAFETVPLIAAMELCAIVEESWWANPERVESATRGLRKCGFRLDELAELPQALRVPAAQGMLDDIGSR